MSSSIENRVVGMRFDNAEFLKAIKQTLDSLDQLDKKLKMEGATKGLSDVHAAAQSVQLGHIGSTVDDIAGRFKAMSVVAITALATIAHSAIEAGASIARSLTIDPINDGLQEYQTNINSIQTILSNTRWQHTGLEDVNKALDELNHYADQTIYNFSQMARNIGTFTAAGVKLDVATGAIKGIANLAAVSGSNAEQASMAMYQLSQALATGTVKLIDWNSVVNAGMGGKVFQDALMRTAKVHGIAIDQMLKDAGSFRATLEQGWLSAQILTETLQQFTGDLTKEQIISMGYTEEQAEEIVAMGLDAQQAATKVKTITQLLSTMRESAGSGWAKTWQLIFGDFEEARTMFTAVNDELGALIQNSADARNDLLENWKELGGRAALIDALAAAFHNLMDFLRPFQDTFREFFPPATAEQLVRYTEAFRDFMQSLRLSDETMDKVQRTFAGVLAVIQIGITVVRKFVAMIFNLVGGLSPAGGSILDITANLGDFLVYLNRAIQDGEGLNKFFNGLEKVLRVPINLLSFLAHLFSTMFDDFDAQGAANNVTSFVKHLGPLGTLADFIVYAWERLINVFAQVFEFFEPLAKKFVEYFHDVSDAVGGINFDDVFKAINSGAFISLVVVLRNSIGRGGLAGSFNQLTETLGAMQHTLQAATLLEIAAAIGILAISVNVLSNIDSEKLAAALSAISVMFTQLLASMVILTKMPSTSVFSLYGTAAALTVMATALVILSVAVKNLSDLEWEEMTKGLVGVSVLLIGIVAATRVIPSGAQLASAGAGLLVVSLGIKVLASAVKDISDLNWEEIGKGLTGVAGLLTSLAIFSRIASVNSTGVLGGAGIVLIATGIKILASAMQDMGSLSWEEIGKGITVTASGLILMGAALNLIPPSAPFSAAGILLTATALVILADATTKMGSLNWDEIGRGLTVMAVALDLITKALIRIPPTAPLSAAGVLILSVAITVLADALDQMGSMSWGEIAKGLTVLAASLTIITLALLNVPAALPGAFALLVVSGALVVLASVLETLGNMSWGEIAKGLGTLALAFIVIGAAALLLSPVIPAMLGLGLSLTMIGGGLALAGAGVLLFATALTALSVAGTAGITALVAVISAVIGLIPTVVKQLGIALLLVIDILIDAVPKIVELVLTILVQVLDGIVDISPKIVATLLVLFFLMVKAFEEAVPAMAAAGLHILLGVLQGIRDNIGEIVRTAADIIENFLDAIGDELPDVIQSGVDLILAFIRGLTKAIDDNAEEMGKAGGDLAVAIIKGMVNGLKGGLSSVSQAAKDVAKSALDSAMKLLGIHSPSKEFEELGMYSDQGFANGLYKLIGVVEDGATYVGQSAVTALRSSISRARNAVSSDMDLQPTVTPVLDLTDIRKNASQIQGILATRPIDISSTTDVATRASVAYRESKEAQAETDSEGNVTFNYTQNNNSPKPLSTADIYRNTNNQIATVKGGLPK